MSEPNLSPLFHLQAARAPEAERLTEAMETTRIMGVLGEAEVGKTATIKQALQPRQGSLLTIDLDGAASAEHLAFLILKQISTAVLGVTGLSLLSVGVLIPASLETEQVELARLIGSDGLDEALRQWPSGAFPLDRALKAIEDLTAERDTTVWIDHLEAPSLTPRHPLDVEDLLWRLRALAQRHDRLNLVLSARDAFDTQLLGRDQAFYQQGRWLSMDNPPQAAWLQVGRRLKVDPDVTAELCALTRGHPATMLRALPIAAEDDRPVHATEIVANLALTAAPLAARAVQHARTLHRLGSQVLTQVAMGMRPYAATQTGSSPPQEIRKVLNRLHVAGLIRHDPGNWSVVDPLVGAVLGQRVGPTAAEDLP